MRKGEGGTGGRLHLRKKRHAEEKKYIHTYIRRRKQARKEIKTALGFIFFRFYYFFPTEGLSHPPLPYIWLPLWGKISFGASSRKKKERDMK